MCIIKIKTKKQAEHLHADESLGGGGHYERVWGNPLLHRPTRHDNPLLAGTPPRVDHQRVRAHRLRRRQLEGNLQAGQRRQSDKRRSRSG